MNSIKRLLSLILIITFINTMLPKVCNIIANCALNVELNLEEIAQNTWNCEYKPNKFRGLIKRYRRSQITVLIFPNGKLTVTGAKTELDAKRGAKMTIKLLKIFKYTQKMTDFKISNIVASYDLKELTNKKSGTVVNLDQLNDTKLNGFRYTKEHYMAAICKHNNTYVTFFYNGKLNFTGSKTREELYDTFNFIVNHLISFKLIDICKEDLLLMNELKEFLINE